jgi:hypothetical protein
MRRRPRLGAYEDEFPAAKFLGGFRRLAIDEQKTAVDQFLHARTRELRAMRSHKPVEPGPGVSI